MCMRTRRALAVGVSLSTLAAGNAFGDTVTGYYDPMFSRDVGVHAEGWNFAAAFGHNASLTTRTYDWTREDLPAGPGVDEFIPENFVSYCVDINETINSLDGGQHVTHTFQVVLAQNAGFTPLQVRLLSRLWGEFQDNVVDIPSSAAFQLCVYEIQFESTNLDITAGSFYAQDLSNLITVRSLASQWLAQVGDLNVALPEPDMVVLMIPGKQDQLTVRVPAPGSAVIGLFGAGVLASRRRSRKA